MYAASETPSSSVDISGTIAEAPAASRPLAFSEGRAVIVYAIRSTAQIRIMMRTRVVVVSEVP